MELSRIGSKDYEIYVERIASFYTKFLEGFRNDFQEFQQWVDHHRERNFKFEQILNGNNRHCIGNEMNKLHHTWRLCSHDYAQESLNEFELIELNIERDLETVKKAFKQANKIIEEERQSNQVSCDIASAILWKD